MKYYIIAGERSGDMHAAGVAEEIKKLDPQAQIRACGGDYLQKAGAEIFIRYEKMAFMGFLEVIKNLFTIKKIMEQCRRDIVDFAPDVLIPVDFSGFNLRISAFAKSRSIPVHYYIAPKVWAWNQKRAHKVKRLVDRLYCILPFEVPFFAKYNLKADFVGNPLMDRVTAFRRNPDFYVQNNLSPFVPIVAVLPGSRAQEVEQMLMLMTAAARKFPEKQFVVAGISNFPESYYRERMKGANVHLVFEQTYDLLASSEAALVTSGTATLETALFNVPQVVCYRTSGVSFAIISRLIRVKFISLPNLVADSEVVKELIQQHLTVDEMVAQLRLIITGGKKRDEVLAGYRRIAQLLGGPGAARTTAGHIVRAIASKNSVQNNL